MQKAQGSTVQPKIKHYTPARSGEAIKASARNGQSYADILKEMKAKVDPRKAALEVLSIRRTRKEEVLLVHKKGVDDSAFHKQLDQAVGKRAEISTLVSTRSLEVRDLNETVEKEEVVSDRVKYIVRRLCSRVGPFQRQHRSSCVVQREELFTLEELKRAGGRLNANMPRIDEVPNEILKEVIGAYPEILLRAFISCIREGRFLADWI